MAMCAPRLSCSRYAGCWPRVIQVGLIADAEIRNSDEYPAVNRLSDVPSDGGLALCCERHTADREMLVGLLLGRFN